MNIPPLQNHVNVADMPLEQLAKNPNVSDSEKVGEACRQFEALMLTQILKEARKPVLNPDSGEESTSTGIYNDMINNQLAQSISRSGTFGLASSLQAQVSHQILPGSATPVGVPPIAASQPFTPTKQ
jgi:flagellar protein FlgJ